MMNPRRRFFQFAAGVAALAAFPRLARPQAYPSRTVRLIAPFGSGGAPDILARMLGQRLSERLGQSFIVEIRPGGGGQIGAEEVARAAPDGHTLLMITPS